MRDNKYPVYNTPLHGTILSQLLALWVLGKALPLYPLACQCLKVLAALRSKVLILCLPSILPLWGRGILVGEMVMHERQTPEDNRLLEGVQLCEEDS